MQSTSIADLFPLSILVCHTWYTWPWYTHIFSPTYTDETLLFISGCLFLIHSKSCKNRLTLSIINSKGGQAGRRDRGSIEKEGEGGSGEQEKSCYLQTVFNINILLFECHSIIIIIFFHSLVITIRYPALTYLMSKASLNITISFWDAFFKLRPVRYDCIFHSFFIACC